MIIDIIIIMEVIVIIIPIIKIMYSTLAVAFRSEDPCSTFVIVDAGSFLSKTTTSNDLWNHDLLVSLTAKSDSKLNQRQDVSSLVLNSLSNKDGLRFLFVEQFSSVVS